LKNEIDDRVFFNFAYLIFRDVQQYLFEHPEEYEAYLKSCDGTPPRDRGEQNE
jgi:hypothetical protein